MFQYPVEQFTELITGVLRRHLPTDTWEWLSRQHNLPEGLAGFNKTFVLIPRKAGKQPVVLTDAEQVKWQQIRPGAAFSGYTVDRLCRVWLLLQLDAKQEQHYLQAIETLFQAAEVSELVALYGALPFFAYPEKWAARCSEGIRSNIGLVLEAIICNNPYPCEQLNDAAWNQLVLKAFFTEKDIHRIVGLDKRNNQKLADTLFDYAHERWAASRQVHPQLWRCVAPFINEQHFEDIQRVVNSTNATEKKAGLLACYHSHYKPAKELLKHDAIMGPAIESGQITWESLATETQPELFYI